MDVIQKYTLVSDEGGSERAALAGGSCVEGNSPVCNFNFTGFQHPLRGYFPEVSVGHLA